MFSGRGSHQVVVNTNINIPTLSWKISAANAAMSTPTNKSGSDVACPPPTFSYAQAAKGRPTTSANPQNTGVRSGSVTPAKDAPHTGLSSSAASANGSNTAEERDTTISDDRKPREQSKGSNRPSVPATQPKAATLVAQASSITRKSTSTPTSPSLGTASTSTIAKEDDSSCTPNASSDSTWDKQSQASVNPEKAGEPALGSKDSAKDDVGEKEPEKEKPKVLMAAPVPAVNFWQQRAQEAKAKASTQLAPAAPAVSKLNGAPRSGQTGANTQDGINKDDPRRRAKGPSGSVGDQMTNVQDSKERRKPIDANARARDDANRKGPARGRGLAEKEGFGEPSAPLAPPPVQDAMLWPTPDVIQEEKKKAAEKSEKADKEKMPPPASKPHGKEKWTHVPYTPSVIFETQLPTMATARRGGKLNRGGGREATGRGGGHMSSGSIGGERANVGPNQIVSASGAASVRDHGRTEFRETQASDPAPRQARRASSAGTSASKDARRPVPAPFVEKKKDPETRVSTTSHSNSHLNSAVNPPYPQPPYHRTSTATQTDLPQKVRMDWKQGGRADGRSMPPPLNTGFKSDRGSMNEHPRHVHPKSAPVDRRDAANRSFDHYRDSGSFLPPRERGDGRPERGRGGYRAGRGGSSNGYATPAAAYTNNAQQGIDPSSGLFYPARGGSFAQQQQHQHQHQASISNGFGTAGKHNRGNSRSQTLSTGNGYGSFNGHPTSAPSMTPISPQYNSLYDYPAMPPLSAVPFAPYAEQYSTLSMVSMQL